MSDLEHLIEEALRPTGAAPPPPSRDLFARVLDSVADDRARRRHRRRVAGLWLAGVAASITLVLTLTPQSNGDLLMPWWILKPRDDPRPRRHRRLARPLHQAVRPRHAADVFHATPSTGRATSC